MSDQEKLAEIAKLAAHWRGVATMMKADARMEFEIYGNSHISRRYQRDAALYNQFAHSVEKIIKQRDGE
jgi:hypothetical protein